MAKTKISELSDSSTLDGTELIPVVQSGSTVKTTTQAIADLASGLLPDVFMSVDVAQTTDPNDYEEGQTFRLWFDSITPPSGIELVRVHVVKEGSGKQWSRNAECFVVPLADWYPCWYDVITNKIIVEFEAKFLVNQSGTSAPVLTEIKNDFATIATFSTFYKGVGDYEVLFSSSIVSSFTYLKAKLEGGLALINTAIAPPFGIGVAFYDPSADKVRIGCALSDGTDLDYALIDTELIINAYIKN